MPFTFVYKNINNLLNDSSPAIAKNVDLIVWPESSISSYILHSNDYLLLWMIGKLKNSKLIAGIPYFSGEQSERKIYNSAVLIGSNTIKNIYHKLRKKLFESQRNSNLKSLQNY